jgi:HrpA-like RNA helicase
LDQNFSLTLIGKEMSELPINPLYSSVIFEAIKRNMLKPIVSMIALLEVENIFNIESKS